MSSFTVRVELHNATEKDYENLHRFMADQGFKRTIISANNVEYQLPTAEYIITDDNLTLSLTLGKAKSAAKKTKKEYEVLTTEAIGISFVNLKK